MVAHIFNPSTVEAEADGSLKFDVSLQSEFKESKTLSRKTKKKKPSRKFLTLLNAESSFLFFLKTQIDHYVGIARDQTKSIVEK